MKTFKTGFYGGKFLPFHKGHNYCIRTAAEQCEKVYVILFYGGDEEIRALEKCNDEFMQVEYRLNHLTEICKQYPNVEIHTVDVTPLKLEDGSEDWDAETPLVVAITGKMDAVYSSEPRYDDYFKRAYPWAKHILVDPPRINYPISGTAIREMEDERKRKEWVL